MIQSGLVDKSEAERIAESIIDRKMKESNQKMEADNFLRQHNSTSKDPAIKVETDEDRSMFENLLKSGISPKQALYAIKGEAITKRAAEDARNFKGREVSTGQSQFSGSLEATSSIKKEDMTISNLGANIDKIFDMT